MKQFASIYGIFLLLLALVPCTDGLHQHQDNQQIAVVMEQAEDQSDPQSDHCNPLCSCHCCHTHTLAKSVALMGSPIGSPFQIDGHHPYLGLLIPHDILQPPKG